MCDSWVTWCLKTDREELADKAHNHFKTTFINKTERKNYKEYYDDFTKVMVFGMFQMDQFMWGYDYDEGGKPSFEEIRTSIVVDILFRRAKRHGFSLVSIIVSRVVFTA